MKMSVTIFIGLIILGVFAGYLSGLIGIGGGIIVVPALIIIFGFSQYAAQGTSLTMMIPPIGLLAVMNYYKSGYVDLKMAGLLCVGFIIGSYLGSKTAVTLPQDTLKKVFAGVLFLISIKMFFQK